MPPLLTYASSRVAALPPAPVMPTITFLSFFSRHAAVMAARSIVTMRVLLDLMDQRLALLEVGLAGLALGEILDVGHDAGRVDAALAHVRLEPRGRVAARARDADDHVLELLFPPRGGHGRALHRDDAGLDPDLLHVRRERLAHREVRRPRIEVARVEAVRESRLREQLLRPRGIEGV